MRRLLGLCLFWTGIGMALMLIFPARFWVFCIMVTLIVVGYNLFCN